MIMRSGLHVSLLAFTGLASAVGTAYAERPLPGLVRYSPQMGGACRACDLSGRVLPGVVMRAGGDFDGALFVSAKIGALKAEGVRLNGADFSYVEAPDAAFSGSLLEKARFRNAYLPNANFNGAILVEADFTGAKVPGADFLGAVGLTQHQLNRACGDTDTKLPPGLSITACPAAPAPEPLILPAPVTVAAAPSPAAP